MNGFIIKEAVVRDNGNYNDGTWKCLKKYYPADKLLDCSTSVHHCPRNCIPPVSKLENVFGEHLLLISNCYAREKTARGASLTNNNRCTWNDATMEEIKVFLGLILNMTLTIKDDVKEL